MELGKISNQTVADMLDNWGSVTLGTATLGLFVNNIAADPTKLVADYTLATFTGYAGVPVEVAGPADIDGDNIDLVIQSGFFQATADSDPVQTVYGWILYTGASLFAVGNITPKTIAETNDWVSISPLVRLSQAG